jgi:elongation factor Ts
VAPYKPSAAEVKALREKTGAGMMDVRDALEEAKGDEGKAIEVLRKKGAASAAKRGGRTTEEGVVASYVHADSRKGALVEVQSETDFVARNPEFLEFARQVAIHITALNPQHVSFEEIPEEDVANERRILEERARSEGKPDNVVEKIVEGQLRKWSEDIVLLDQKHFNQEVYEGKTIEDLRSELASKTGENVRIARFARFEVGQE